MKDSKKVEKLLRRAVILATEYKLLTGKPLGITGEIGEFVAAELLGLELQVARSPGYDALDKNGARVQIKTRCIPNTQKPRQQRIGSIRFHYSWDKVVLVVLSHDYTPIELLEASRRQLKRALEKPGSRARNERGALSISAFRRIGKRIWPKSSLART